MQAGRRGPRSCPRLASAGRRPGAAGLSSPLHWGRPARRHDRAGWTGCSPTAPTGAGTACPARGLPERGSCYVLLGGGPKRTQERASMLSSSSPARRALVNQRCRSRRSGPCAASEAPLSVAVTNVPTPGRAAARPSVLQLAVGLEHSVRVDRQPRHYVLDRGELVALAQQPEPHAPAGPGGSAAGTARRPNGRPLATRTTAGGRRWSTGISISTS